MAFCVREASKFFVDLMILSCVCDMLLDWISLNLGGWPGLERGVGFPRIRGSWSSLSSSALGCALIRSCVVDLGIPVSLAFSHMLNGFRVLRGLRVTADVLMICLCAQRKAAGGRSFSGHLLSRGGKRAWISSKPPNDLSSPQVYCEPKREIRTPLV